MSIPLAIGAYCVTLAGFLFWWANRDRRTNTSREVARYLQQREASGMTAGDWPHVPTISAPIHYSGDTV